MEQDSTTTPANGMGPFPGKAWFDPIEAGVRERVRGFIEELLEQELTQALGRSRHEWTAAEPKGYRNGSRERQLLGSFGPVRISVPRVRMRSENGGTQEWRSAALPRYCRMTRQVEALIAGAYLAAPTRTGSSARYPPYSLARLARTLLAGPGARFARTGRPGVGATWPVRTLSV